MKKLIKTMLRVGGINKIHAETLLAGTELYEQVIKLKKKGYEFPTIDIEYFEDDNEQKFLH